MSDYGNLVVGLREEIESDVKFLGMESVGKEFGFDLKDVKIMTTEEFIERCVAIELENAFK